MMTQAFMHFRLGSGAMTAAIRVTPSGEGQETQTAAVGLAFCAPGDNFSRRIGRALAQLRLKLNQEYFEMQISAAQSIKKQVAREIITRVVGNDGNLTPQWARQWLRETFLKEEEAIQHLLGTK
jgi:hypothetical protein